ncbi:MAG TPA: 2-amino-4-hydroxy-6-hydroxymethyldihydropteridine diphosphokinase [Microbacteriaceae bacterium]|nr:2-amino-4-hydroxy-6-hydroxymethyldihydropteridine diphosphokinase [Microbacteriaceae bacterium]
MTGGIRSPKPQRLRVDAPVVLALGSNLGDRAATIRAAVTALDAVAGVRVRATSGLVESAAVKLSGVDADAPRYLNAVALALTTLDPYALLDAVNRIEADFGRVRAERWGDRTLDIDIVDYDGRRLNDERLTLPHPRAAERAFVLVPWAQLDPDARLDGHGSVAELAAAVADDVVAFDGAAGASGASDASEPSEPGAIAGGEHP